MKLVLIFILGFILGGFFHERDMRASYIEHRDYNSYSFWLDWDGIPEGGGDERPF